LAESSFLSNNYQKETGSR